MGKSMYCDLCHTNIVVESQIIPVIIGKNIIGEFCLTCSSTLEQGIKTSIAEAAAKVNAAKTAAVPPAQEPQPAAPTAPPEVPAAAQPQEQSGGT